MSSVFTGDHLYIDAWASGTTVGELFPANPLWGMTNNNSSGSYPIWGSCGSKAKGPCNPK